jgi:predicted P-loop ATPase
VNAVKAFFSTRNDTFRPPFGRHVITSPRRNAFGGTTNEEQYLIDPTGNRRFLCIKLEDKDVDIKALQKDRDQLWAEAVVLYDRHVNHCEDKLHCGCWWFVGNEVKELAIAAEERVHESPIEIAIEEWWYSIESKFRPKSMTGTFIARDILKYTQDRISRSVLIEIGFAAKKLGFLKTRDSVGKRAWIYTPTDTMLAAAQSDYGKSQSANRFKPKSAQGAA